MNTLYFCAKAVESCSQVLRRSMDAGKIEIKAHVRAVGVTNPRHRYSILIFCNKVQARRMCSLRRFHRRWNYITHLRRPVRKQGQAIFSARLAECGATCGASRRLCDGKSA